VLRTSADLSLMHFFYKYLPARQVMVLRTFWA
jgi:hypothetical protein